MSSSMEQTVIPTSTPGLPAAISISPVQAEPIDLQESHSVPTGPTAPSMPILNKTPLTIPTKPAHPVLATDLSNKPPSNHTNSNPASQGATNLHVSATDSPSKSTIHKSPIPNIPPKMLDRPHEIPKPVNVTKSQSSDAIQSQVQPSKIENRPVPMVPSLAVLKPVPPVAAAKVTPPVTTVATSPQAQAVTHSAVTSHHLNATSPTKYAPSSPSSNKQSNSTSSSVKSNSIPPVQSTAKPSPAVTSTSSSTLAATSITQAKLSSSISDKSTSLPTHNLTRSTPPVTQTVTVKPPPVTIKPPPVSQSLPATPPKHEQKSTESKQEVGLKGPGKKDGKGEHKSGALPAATEQPSPKKVTAPSEEKKVAAPSAEKKITASSGEKKVTAPSGEKKVTAPSEEKSERKSAAKTVGAEPAVLNHAANAATVKQTPDVNKSPRKIKIAEKTPSRKRESQPSVDEDSSKPKRARIQTQVYQAPLPDLNFIPRSLKTTPKKTPDEKLTLFFKNEFMAVRNAEGTFFVCQAAQNIGRGAHRIRIRWLSQLQDGNPDKDIYSPDFYDYIDFECILTSLQMRRVDKDKYRLPQSELQRTENILKRALDVEQGLSPSQDLTEDHPDGLDISLYKDESQLKTKRTPTVKAKASPRVSSLKQPSSTSKKSPKTKRMAKKTPPIRNRSLAKEDKDEEDEVKEEYKPPAKKPRPPPVRESKRTPVRSSKTASIVPTKSPAKPPATKSKSPTITPKASPKPALPKSSVVKRDKTPIPAKKIINTRKRSSRK